MTNVKTEQKMDYEAPSLETLGTFEDVTQGASTGEFTDAAFPVHTPKSALTFS